MSKRVKSRGLLMRVAVHEAAHVEVGRHLGLRAGRVSFTRKEPRHWVGEVPVSDSSDPMQQALVSLAGPAAEQVFFGQRRTHISQEDHDHVVALGFRGRSLSTLLDHAIALVQELTPKIMRRAAALVERQWGKR